MNHRYHILGCLLALMGLIVSLLGCTDELEGGFKPSRPSDVICFTASLSDSRAGAISRGSSGHLAIEQEEWLVGVEKKQGISRGAPVTLLSGSAGVIGIGFGLDDNNTESVWSDNAEYVFDGDELTSKTSDVRWSTLAGNNSVSCYVYAPYNASYNASNISGKTINYRVESTVTEQEDLIVASWQGSKGINYGENIDPQTIPLVFEHALTAVKFKVGFDCTVKELRIEGIYNSGIYTFGSGWTVDETSTDSYTFEFESSNSLAANAPLTDGDNTLMMIPQTLPTGAKVVLTYINKNGDEKRIISFLEGREWEEGKMVTYTIHESNAPATIYFDLAAGDVAINSTTFSGKIYINGEVKDVVGKHESRNQYYVYQSTTLSDEGFSSYNRFNTGYVSEEDYTKQVNCRVPKYNPVRYNNKLWSEFITNHTDVNQIIDLWNSDVHDVAQAVGRTGAPFFINVTGNLICNLTIDNLFSTIQHTYGEGNKTGIRFYPDGNNSKLTINMLGDNRFGSIRYFNTEDNGNEIIFGGTGSLTVADVNTLKDIFKSNPNSVEGYYSNHFNSVIGATDHGPKHSYGITINSGVIYAGSTAAENCSAIGGGGNGTAVISIHGGTVTAVASTTGTAIGGGIGFSSAGGKGYVTITGGNVYAYNLENPYGIPSAAIGGAGSSGSSGSLGEVTITGGNVYALSVGGTAIGGGSSKVTHGGKAEVKITGGNIIAKSIAGKVNGSHNAGAGIGGGTGGSNVGANGGNADIVIKGNPIIRTGSIGGGKTNNTKGSIGSANIEISESPDIQAQFVMASGASVAPTFIMAGGTIRNSDTGDSEYIHIKKNGGAVYLEDGTFTMTGGIIKKCSAVQGGAVYIDSQAGNSTFKMSGGEIHSCFATGEHTTSGHGGAVYLNGGQVQMTGGKIWNNYSVNGDGGAVYISNGNFFMQDGFPEISGNSAQKGSGGGVFVSSAGSGVQVNLLHGLITGNSSNNYGGGVCVDMEETAHAASVIVGKEKAAGEEEDNTTPNISGNAAMLSGGGLYVRGANANITINGGNIKGNSVSAYVKNENVANEGGMVTLNADNVTNFVTVTFNINDAKNESTTSIRTYQQKVVSNTNSNLSKNQFVFGGKKFVRWNNRPDNLGDISYEDGAKINISKDITLYAIWTDQ